jgi:hypothetical protein
MGAADRLPTVCPVVSVVALDLLGDGWRQRATAPPGMLVVVEADCGLGEAYGRNLVGVPWAPAAGPTRPAHPSPAGARHSSKEYQIVKMTGMMNFHIDPAFVNDLYQKVGLDFANKVIDPAFNDFVKEVVPTYPIGEILPKREEIRQTAMKKLGNNLARYHILVDDIYFANIRFSPEYEKAIEAKQVAQQQVETQKQVLAQREIEAQQKVATAKGEAESIFVVAQEQAKPMRS